MFIEGKTAAENQARHKAIVEAVGTDWPTGGARTEEIRKRWAKACGKPYKPRLSAIGEPIKSSPPSEEDRTEDHAAKTATRARGIRRAELPDS